MTLLRLDDSRHCWMVSVVSVGCAIALVIGASQVPTVTSANAAAVSAESAPRSTKITYPSWGDIQRAKGHVSATKRQVASISTALASLQAQAAHAGDAAVAASVESDRAASAALQAQSEFEQLDAQRRSSERKALEAKRLAGLVVIAMSRGSDGIGLESELLTSPDPTSLLNRLGMLDQVSGTSARTLVEASAAQSLASSLARQSDAARRVRDALAKTASVRAKAAATASTSADQAVAAEQKHQQTLFAQLATLQNTTAALEQRRRQGLAAEAAFKAQQAAAARLAAKRAAERARRPSSSGGSTGGAPAVPILSVGSSSGSNAPSAAKSFAKANLGAFGWNLGQNGCLISLWTRESGWRYTALNLSSGAYGIPQSLPGSKMASIGADWRTNARTQITWGLGYIKAAYGSPCAAWRHETSAGWY